MLKLALKVRLNGSLRARFQLNLVPRCGLLPTSSRTKTLTGGRSAISFHHGTSCSGNPSCQAWKAGHATAAPLGAS